MKYLLITLSLITISCSTPTQADYSIKAQFLHYSETVPEANRLAVFQEIKTDHKFLVNVGQCDFNKNWRGKLQLNNSENGYLILAKCPTSQ